MSNDMSIDALYNLYLTLLYGTYSIRFRNVMDPPLVEHVPPIFNKYMWKHP